MFVLDTMAKDLKDPLITCHLGTMNSPTRTSVKVSIVTAGYDTILRTQLVIHVGEKQASSPLFHLFLRDVVSSEQNVFFHTCKVQTESEH